MRILLDSNAPWAPTGYGVQGASLALRLKKAGHDVVYYANYGLHGGIIEWNGIKVLPGAKDGYDDPIIQGHLRYVQPDLLITLFDIWVWGNEQLPLPVGDTQFVRWAAWIPIDHAPLSIPNQMALTKCMYPIAMSQFGFDQLKAAGADNAIYIPHGIEKDFGYTQAGRKEFRRYLQIPENAFLFGTVGLNRHYPCRKGYDQLIEALSLVPDAYLYIHALPESQAGSVDLRKYADFYGVGDRIRYADTYNYVMGYSQTGMNAMYSALDCYVQPTQGEGFGVPVIEAQACGCVVIATDCTSMPELCCPNSSELIPPAAHYMTPDIAHRWIIDPMKLAEQMKEIMRIKRDDPNGFDSMRANAGLWANNWDWDTIWNEHWVPFLKEVEEDVKGSPMKAYHRGGARLYPKGDRMRKQDSRLQSPAVKKELDLLLTLDHPNIIKVLDHGVEDELTWFEMPMLKGLQDVDCKELSEEQRQRILDGVDSALKYLHDRQLCHRDVEPSNVLVDEDYNPYLTDFAWAHPCDGEPCVDYEPWLCLDKAVTMVQLGIGQRGYHTIVSHVRGIDLRQSGATGLPGVPYQAVDGVGERDCQTRWDLMKPDVKGKRVLDVGCNLGWFVRKSLEEGADWAVGLDSDYAVIQAAEKLGPGQYNVLDLDADFTGGGEFYDIVFLLSVLQHLRDPDRVLREVMEIASEIYIEIPPRFITPYMAEILSEGTYLGESERGRPIYRVEVQSYVKV